MKGTSVLIIGGGTGGHISPGLALYEELKRQGVRALFLSGKRDERFSSLAEVAPGDLFLYRAPAITKNPLKLPFFVLSFLGARSAARGIMKRNAVGAVVGMGGYVSAPALLAARSLGIPVYLCEQNSVPGRVTRLFEKGARRVYGTFQCALKEMNYPDKYRQVGNPLRAKALSSPARDEARRHFNLAHCRRVILAIGGSQGARTINELIFGLKKQFPDEMKHVGIIWSTGDGSYQTWRDRVQEIADGSLYLSPFIEKVGMAYRAADLAICRSGAGVMMEIAAMGLPSIQIPYPFAAMNHQEYNADEFVEAGAAIKIMDADAVPQTVMPVLRDLLASDAKLSRMAEKARGLARSDAAAVIVNDLLADAGITPADRADEKGE